ncbi:MAG TPA: hypothetical protein VNI78_11595 [Vicinamibacterales bacterium]|nr:hypothetical protein [Vicinamibacterales bacterium]
MRYCFAVLAAGVLFVSPVLSESLLSQQSDQGAVPAAQQVVGGGSDPAQGGVAPAGRQGGARQGGGGRGRQAGPPAGPAPRNEHGRVVLGGKGLWLPTIGITVPVAPVETIPFQPWAKAVYDDRQKHELEPHTRCKPSGVARQFMTPYGVEFVELPELDRLYIFDVGGPHTYRTVYMDGRTHPKNPTPTYYGHSIGWWEGDTLVIDTVGFNENFWLDRRGVPHTDKLHTIERFTRTDANTIVYEVIVDDPGAYTKPWKGGFNLRWQDGQELFEYICQQANYAHELMVGDHEKVERTSSIVP